MCTKEWDKHNFTEMNNVQQKGHSNNNSLTHYMKCVVSTTT